MADKKISQLSNASTPLAGTEVLPIVQSATTVKVATDDLTVKNIRSNATSGILQIAGPAAAATRTMTVPDANFTAARTDAGQTFTGTQVMTSPRIITSVNDTNGNELIGVTATASAVNEITVANAATGNRPTISATGGDTNIGIALTPKGSGDVAVTSGNLVISTAAKGIDFSANSHAAGMTSELLNWYEEGTWTATVTGSTSGSAAGFYVNTCAYTRIGRQVTATGFVVISGVGTMVGDVLIGGLPFTSKNTTYLEYAGSIGLFTTDPTVFAGGNAYSQVLLVLGANSSTMAVRKQVNGTSSGLGVSGTLDISFTITYFV